MAEKVECRLTVIVSADVVAYARLIRADETGTRVTLRGHRESLIAFSAWLGNGGRRESDSDVAGNGHPRAPAITDRATFPEELIDAATLRGMSGPG